MRDTQDTVYFLLSHRVAQNTIPYPTLTYHNNYTIRDESPEYEVALIPLSSDAYPFLLGGGLYQGM